MFYGFSQCGDFEFGVNFQINIDRFGKLNIRVLIFFTKRNTLMKALEFWGAAGPKFSINFNPKNYLLHKFLSETRLLSSYCFKRTTNSENLTNESKKYILLRISGVKC